MSWFQEPKTHEFRVRKPDGTWDTEWWKCGASFVTLVEGRDDIETRERAPEQQP